MKPPFVRDVSSLLDRPQLIARERGCTGHYFPFIDNIIDRLSSQPAFGCLLIDDLFPWGSPIDRLRRSIEEYSKPIAFVYTENNTKIITWVHLQLGSFMPLHTRLAITIRFLSSRRR
jgi:hypothetical protein